MAVSDNALITVALILLNYLMFWCRDGWKRVISDFFFVFIGIASYIYFSTSVPWGIIIAIFGIIDLVFILTRINS